MIVEEAPPQQSRKSSTEDDEEGEAAKDVIIASIRESKKPLEEGGDSLLAETEELTEEREIEIVNELNVDFPPEDHPPDIADLANNNNGAGKLEDLVARAVEKTQTLKAVKDQKKSIQAKYDTLVKESAKNEENLKGTITMLMKQIRSGSSSKPASATENKLSTVTTERDELSKKVSSIQLEKIELGRKLDEAKSANVTDLTTQLSAATEESARIDKELKSATDDLATAWEKIESLAIKATQLQTSNESLTAQRDAANNRVQELLASDENVDGVLSSLMAERSELASSVEEINGQFSSLEEEKLKAVSKATSLEATIDELQGRIESLSAELNTKKVSSESKVSSDMEAKYKSTINDLEAKLKRQSEEALTLNDVQITDLKAEVSKLKDERDELATKTEEATSQLSKLQSTFDILNNEREAAQAKVKELLSGNKHSDEVMEALNAEKTVLISKIDQCIERLYLEKDGESSQDDAAELERLHGEEKLEAQLKQKEVQMAKLVKDKEKLEAYTKQTLQIFQQKYFGTTQEYKTKLKLKDQLIETLEAKLAKEKRRKEEDDDT